MGSPFLLAIDDLLILISLCGRCILCSTGAIGRRTCTVSCCTISGRSVRSSGCGTTT